MRSLFKLLAKHCYRNLVLAIKPAAGYYLFGRQNRSTRPLSYSFGFDRGTPIDRYYIELFLEKQRKSITGVCLEVTDEVYIRKYGRKVTKADILDIDQSNQKATIIDDLRSLAKVKDNTYDCVLLTHVLGMVDDIEAAVKQAYRVLKPGGVLLATHSCLGPMWGKDAGCWRLLPKGAKYLFGKYFDNDQVMVEPLGNVLSGQAFWVGMSLEDLTEKELSNNDDSFPVILGIKAIKK
jgi:SAM-dependent methyltransferase